jgi:nucleoid-associated protein EbfC
MNMQNLMAQAQKMQRDIQKKQEEINSMEFIGESQAVKVTMSGKKLITKVEINKSIIKDSEDIEMLEDMIQIAVNDAISKIDKEIDSKLGMYSHGLNGLM